jgi:hypothetical protein
MTLDPYTDFWVSQDGARVDDATRGNLEMREAASEVNDEPEQRWDDDPIVQATQAASDEVRGRENDKGDWDSSKEHREWLSERYPGTKLNDYGAKMLDWHQYFQRDPANAKEAWIRHWASRPPFHHRPSAKPQKEEAPSDWWAEGKREWALDRDVVDAVRGAARNREDESEFANTNQLRQLLRQNGMSLTDFLDKCRLLETASLDDPAGVAHRFAVFSGLPATERQAQELQAALQQQHAYAEQKRAAAEDLTNQMGINALPQAVQDKMASFIDDAAKQGLTQDPRTWPALVQQAERSARVELRLEKEHLANTTIDEFRSDPANKHYERLEGEIARLLTTGQVQRTGDMRADLKTAYDMAVRRNPEIAAEKARRAARSVTGGPAPGARSAATQRSRGGSYDDDLFGDVADAVRARSI